METVSLDNAQQTQLMGSGTVTVNQNNTVAFSPSAGIEIDSLGLKSGTLAFVFNSDFQFSGNASVNIVLPDLKLNGQPFNKTIPINNLNGTTSKTYDISGYTFDMTDGGTTFNAIPMQYAVTLNYTGGSVGPTDNIEIVSSIESLAFSKVFGDFGQQIISTDRDSILIRIFENSSSGSFQLTNPKLRIDVTNSFGFPVQLDFTTLESITTNTIPSVVTPIEYLGNTPPFTLMTIGAPGISQMGQSVTSSIEINNSNSDFATLMEPTPKYVHHAIQAVSNPAGGASSNFITDESLLIIDTQVELPLEGYANGWGLIDTLAFEFGEGSFENIEEMLFRINVDNALPVNARLQLYFTDSVFNVLDSLMDGRTELFESGVVNSDGKVTAATNKITDIIVDQERAPKITRAKYIIVWAEAETYNAGSNQIVKIFDDNYINVRLGVKIDGNVKL